MTRGSSAQVEALCRISTLYPMINCKKAWNDFYGPHRALHNPVYNGDLIYSPDVIVFKSDTDAPELMPEEDWYKVNVISCAAPNLRRRPSNRMNPHAEEQRIILTEDERTLTIYDLEGNRHCIPYNCLLKWVELQREERRPSNFNSYAEMEERINEVLNNEV